MNIKISNKNIIWKICFTGMMFSLVIIFQYLEKYIPPGTSFTKINLSLIFILITQNVIGWKWSLTLLILRFGFGPALGQNGYGLIGLVSQLVLLVSDSIFIIIFSMLKLLLSRKKEASTIQILISLVLSIIITSLLAAVINAVVLTPLFWYVWGWTKDASFNSAILFFKKSIGASWFDTVFFGIENYWMGVITSFGVGYLVKYSSISFLYFLLIKITRTIKK